MWDSLFDTMMSRSPSTLATSPSAIPEQWTREGNGHTMHAGESEFEAVASPNQVKLFQKKNNF
eukprot:UN08027